LFTKVFKWRLFIATSVHFLTNLREKIDSIYFTSKYGFVALYPKDEKNRLVAISGTHQVNSSWTVALRNKRSCIVYSGILHKGFVTYLRMRNLRIIAFYYKQRKAICYSTYHEVFVELLKRL